MSDPAHRLLTGTARLAATCFRTTGELLLKVFTWYGDGLLDGAGVRARLASEACLPSNDEGGDPIDPMTREIIRTEAWCFIYFTFYV